MPITGPTTDHREIRSWGTRHNMIPTELHPHRVDHEPALLCLLPVGDARNRKDLRIITWEEFFARFDLLGLAIVYDEEHTGYNELLQREGHGPKAAEHYRHRLFKH